MNSILNLKYLLIASLLSINSLPIFSSSSTCAELVEQTIIKQRKQTIDALLPPFFYAFHEHNLNSELDIQSMSSSLYERYSQLPEPLKGKISEYLKNFSYKNNVITSELIMVDDLKWHKDRKIEFRKSMIDLTWPELDTKIKYIKECLRVEYWYRNLRKINRKTKGINQELECSPLCTMTNIYKDNILSVACENDYLEIAALAIACGASIDIYSHRTPLHTAIKKDFCIMSALLINSNFYTANKETNESLLHSAALYNALKVIKYLYNIGHNINSQDSNGNTPLHLAYKEGNDKAIKLFLALRIDKTIKNNEGKLPYEIYLSPFSLTSEFADKLKKEYLEN